MNDALYEQLVSRKPSPLVPVMKVLLICLMAAGLVLALFFVGFFPALAVIALAFLLYYFVFPLLSVEYEYTFLNYDVDIDAIYNKSRRKKKLSFDLRTAEQIAPASSVSPALRRSSKVLDFTSHEHPDRVYSVLIGNGRSQMNVLMELDDKSLSHFTQWAGNKMQRA